MNKKNFIALISFFTILYVIRLILSGYFSIGLLSDDYYNLFDAANSSFLQKFTGKLAFTNVLHLRPIYYISIRLGYFIHSLAGLSFENFINFRIGNLILFILFAYISARLVFQLSGNYYLSILAYLSILLYPPNAHNICWTAGRVDILCGLFFALYLLYSFKYFENKKNPFQILSFIFLTCSLLSKETGITAFAVLVIFVLYFHGKKGLTKNKKIFIIHFAIIALYLVYKFTLGQMNISQSPGEGRTITFVKAMLGFVIPEDFLTLQYQLKANNLTMLYYFVIFVGFSFVYFIYLFQFKIFKLIMFALLIAIVLVSPYVAAGYVRPQLMLIPFSMIVIFLSSAGTGKDKTHIAFRKASFIMFIPVLIFWAVLFSQNLYQWGNAYKLSIQNISDIEAVNFDKSKINVVFGDRGRINQTFVCDKLTGAYNYWKYRQPAIKDTLYDIVLLGGLNDVSITKEIRYEKIDDTHFKINTDDENLFLYIEGFNLNPEHRIYEDNKVKIEFYNFNYLKKPSSMLVTVKSADVNCYLFNPGNVKRIN